MIGGNSTQTNSSQTSASKNGNPAKNNRGSYTGANSMIKLMGFGAKPQKSTNNFIFTK